MIALKAPALAAVARQIGPMIGPDTLVLTAMNGVPWWFLQGFGGPVANRTLASVDPGGLIASALPASHIVGCVVHASCSVDAPGVIRHHFGDGLIVGEPSGLATPRVQALHALLRQAGFNATLSPQIQKDIWYKLWGNMTVNPVSALTGATTDRILMTNLCADSSPASCSKPKPLASGSAFPLPRIRTIVMRSHASWGVSHIHAAGCTGWQADRTGCDGGRGARTRTDEWCGHTLYRYAAGSESPAGQGAGAVPATMSP